MEKRVFDEFFEPYAKNVDNANQHHFWKLSDAIILRIIQKHIPRTSELHILDAGGGTGRWICNLANSYPGRFTLYDRSEHMLERAKNNIAAAKITERVTIQQGDMTDMSSIETESVDHIVSIYSPISFIHDTEKAFSELFRILKPGGKILIMGHGFHNALYSKINNYLAKAEELATMDGDMTVKWGPHVPVLNTFSKESMEDALKKSGFTIIETTGIPVFVQPGPEDFDPENKTKSRISAALDDPELFETILALEMKYNAQPTVCNRGMNIFSIGQK